MTRVETEPNMGAPPGRNLFGRFHHWVKSGDGWFISHGARFIRTLTITWVVGGLIWALTDSRGMAAVGLIVAGCLEIYRTEVRKIRINPTFWVKVCANLYLGSAILYMLLSPLFFGLALKLIDDGLLVFDFELLSQVADIGALSLAAIIAGGLVPITGGMFRGLFERQAGYASKTRVFAGILCATLCISLFSIFVDKCIAAEPGCDDIPLSQTIFQLDGGNQPSSLNRALYLFVRPSALGNQIRYEKLQILFEKHVNIVLFLPGLLYCLAGVVATVSYRLNSNLRK